MRISDVLPDLRETRTGARELDPLAQPAEEQTPRRRLLDALVAARRSGDHELANRLLGELVDLNEAEKKELENG